MSFEMRLKEKNLKVTPQRMAILNVIKKNGHIAIEEIYDNIRKDYPSISLATVYKNIASLHEANILQEVKIPSHRQRYELANQRHIHVACEKCGKLEDVYMNLDDVMMRCGEMTHYQLHNVSAVFLGCCKQCSSSKNDN